MIVVHSLIQRNPQWTVWIKRHQSYVNLNKSRTIVAKIASRFVRRIGGFSHMKLNAPISEWIECKTIGASFIFDNSCLLPNFHGVRRRGRKVEQDKQRRLQYLVRQLVSKGNCHNNMNLYPSHGIFHNVGSFFPHCNTQEKRKTSTNLAAVVQFEHTQNQGIWDIVEISLLFPRGVLKLHLQFVTINSSINDLLFRISSLMSFL